MTTMPPITMRLVEQVVKAAKFNHVRIIVKRGKLTIYLAEIRKVVDDELFRPPFLKSGRFAVHIRTALQRAIDEGTSFIVEPFKENR